MNWFLARDDNHTPRCWPVCVYTATVALSMASSQPQAIYKAIKIQPQCPPSDSIVPQGLRPRLKTNEYSLWYYKHLSLTPVEVHPQS